MPGRGIRQSERICIAVPIQVRGAGADGRSFMEETQTLTISRHGAAIVLRHRVAPEQDLIIQHTGASKEAEFRVLRVMGEQGHRFIYGVTLKDKSVNLWGIEFPPLSEAEKAVGRALLECGRCQTQKVIYLDELEVEAFEANQGIWRPCKCDMVSSLWKLTAHEGPAEPPPRLPPASASEVLLSPGMESPNRRKEVRVNVSMPVCIRQFGGRDEAAVSMNLSRGGLCFKSLKPYPHGSNIEIAVPYAPAGANIFALAYVVYSKESAARSSFLHGVAYLRNYDSSPPSEE